MSNKGNKGTTGSCSVILRYEAKKGAAQELRSSFQLTGGDEWLRLVRHNISTTARARTEDGTDVIKFREEDAVPDVIRYHYKKNDLVPEHGGGYYTDRTGANATKDGTDTGDAKKPGVQVPLGTVAPKKPTNRPILLLLESPHVAEVNCDLKGWFPAVGSTGGQIHKRRWVLRYVLSQLNSDQLQDAPLIICNPLPHPASLRVVPLNTTLRNAVFTTAMDLDGVKQGFEQRLDDYDPLVIINACTATGSKPHPKSTVSTRLETWLHDKIVRRDVYVKKSNRIVGTTSNDTNATRYLIELPHPAGWFGIKAGNWFHKRTDGGLDNQAFRDWMTANCPTEDLKV